MPQGVRVRVSPEAPIMLKIYCPGLFSEPLSLESVTSRSQWRTFLDINGYDYEFINDINQCDIVLESQMINAYNSNDYSGVGKPIIIISELFHSFEDQVDRYREFLEKSDNVYILSAAYNNNFKHDRLIN